MTKTVLLASAAMLALSMGGASAAAPTMVHNNGKALHHKNLGNRSLSVLYDQTSNDSGIGIVSQNFESSFDIYDAQAADDFTVPAGTIGTVKEVDATGVYFNGSGPANSENVTFYKNSHGAPGDVVAEFDGVVGADSFGSFAIDLGKGHKFKGGKHGKTYWVSVQANLDFSAGGEWGWENQTTSEGNAAMWVNAGDGFATGCTTYSQENVCIPDGQGDHMFTLRGKSK